MMNPRSRLRDRIREATSEAILEAAEELFGKEGLHGAKIERIAAAAGVSVGTLYNHFEDRQTLLRVLDEARRAEMTQVMDAALARTDQPFHEQLSEMLGALVRYYEQHQRYFSILMQGELDKGEGKSQRAQAGKSDKREGLRELRLKLGTVIERGVAQGVLDPQMASLAPTFLVGCIRGVFVRALLEEQKDIKPQMDQLVRFFLHGAGRRDV